MIEARWQFRAEAEMLGTEFFRNLLQCLQMRRGITIPERVIGNEIEAALEESAQ
jgi:hypothetical protein